jgi:hypothetical protein
VLRFKESASNAATTHNGVEHGGMERFGKRATGLEPLGPHHDGTSRFKAGQGDPYRFPTSSRSEQSSRNPCSDKSTAAAPSNASTVLDAHVDHPAFRSALDHRLRFTISGTRPVSSALAG